MMKRVAPEPAELTFRAESLKASFRVETPVHGGGVRWDDNESHVRPIDPVTPVRVSAIRGQLRFWWRATTGCTFESLAAMKEREDALWGRASRPGAIALALKGPALVESRRTVFESVQKPARDGRPATWEAVLRAGTGIGYGAFALQPPKSTLPAKPKDGFVTELQGTATLELRAARAEELEQVTDALRAWLLFGNIGGRGRRGFGAVIPTADSAKTFDLADARRVVSGWRRPSTLPLIPSLHGAQLRTVSEAEVENAYRALGEGLERLRRFRQGNGQGREKRDNDKHPGRSRWPDPDEVRRLYPSRSEYHHPPIHPVRKTPRGAFGMPIVFHYAPGDGPTPDAQLLPADAERMASPLWIRPLRIGQSYHAAALLLKVPGLDLSRLRLTRGNEAKRASAALEPGEIKQIGPLHDNGDLEPLQAFLNFFEHR